MTEYPQLNRIDSIKQTWFVSWEGDLTLLWCWNQKVQVFSTFVQEEKMDLLSIVWRKSKWIKWEFLGEPAMAELGDNSSSHYYYQQQQQK